MNSVSKLLNKKLSIRSLILLLVLSLLLVFVMSRFDDFKQSIDALRGANLYFVLLAVVFAVSSYAFAAMSYKSLVYYHVPFKLMYLIQLAGSFASKLVPAGAGGIALNVRFLTKSKHTITQATAIAAINNTMGFIGHTSLLIIVVFIGASSFSEAFDINLSVSPLISLIFFLAVLVLLFLSLNKTIRRKLSLLHKQVMADFKQYFKHPSKLVGSYFASIGITLCYVGALFASAQALGSTLSPLQVLVVFTAGIAVASITPTPGGLGGVEAALVASLTATGMIASQALAVTLLYRLATYWIPMIPGYVAFQYSANKKYI